MSRVIQTAFAWVIGATTGNWGPFVMQLFGHHQDSKNRKQRRRLIAESNAAIPDRLQLLDMEADAARSIVLGRNRTIEGIRRKWVSGAQNEKLTMIVSVAGHEIDAFEAFYFDDQEITLDASGWVLTAPWAKTRREIFTKQAVLNGSGGAVLTLTDTAPPDATGQTVVLGPPIASTAFAVWETGSGDNLINGSATVSVVGTTATVTGGQAGTTVTVSYARDIGVSYARVRAYRGAPGQNVGAAIAAEYPGKITASDKFTGIAVLVLDFTYDTDIYTQGPPKPTVLVRGARVYDPRKDSMVPGGSGAHRLATPGTWEYSANPALCAYHYARHANGWAVPGAEIRTADVVEAANFCDLNTAFTLRKPDTSTSVVNLPRYSCGIVINTAGDPGQAMDEIMETMAGRKAWCGGSLRMRAGMRKAPSFTVTPDWIAVPEGEEGGESPVQIINGVLRDSRINRVTGKCIDPDLRYQMLAFPAVEDPVLIADKGLAATEVEFNGVNHIAQAQHLGTIAIRETQATLRMNLRCGMRAWPAEVLDVGAIQLPRFGLAGNTMEVVGTRWHPIEGVRLKLEEISEGMYTPVAELRGRDPAPDSNLPAPWDVGVLTGLTVASNVSTLADGSIVTRTVVGWDLATRRSVRQGGEIEVQYIQATGTLPPGEWPSTTERGNAVSTTIVGLPAGRFFRFRARPVQLVPMVRGDWVVSPPHLVAGPRAPRVYRQAAVPSAGVQDGDEWYDTDDGNHHYVRVSGSWVSVRDTTIATALSTAQAAQATADGKIDTFWQTTAPSSASEGDLWFDTDDGLKQYRRTSGAWVLAADTRIGQAISDAADAQATADGKVRTFVQTSAPTAEAVGDLWFDTDDGFKLYRWSGSAWVNVRDTGIALALTNAAAAQATADGKIDTFWQATPPSSSAEGDIWFDTDDGYKQYRRTSGAWVLAADTRIGQAISDAADAQATADGKVRTFVQAAAPMAESIGDLWFDTDDGYKPHRWNGSSWISVQDTSIAAALAAANDAQATADGKIATFYQTTAPSSGVSSVGDLWFDTDDGFKQYRYSGSAWVIAADTRIGQAITDAADAQATADGKVVTFVQASAPTAEAVGDLWLDSDDGNKLYRWSGSAWVALPVGTGAITPGAATSTDFFFVASGTVGVNVGDPGDAFTAVNSTLGTLIWTNTTTGSVAVQMEFGAAGYYANVSGAYNGGVNFSYRYSISGGGSSLSVASPGLPRVASADREFGKSLQVLVPAGATITASLVIEGSRGAFPSANNAVYEAAFGRLTAILR